MNAIELQLDPLIESKQIKSQTQTNIKVNNVKFITKKPKNSNLKKNTQIHNKENPTI